MLLLLGLTVSALAITTIRASTSNAPHLSSRTCVPARARAVSARGWRELSLDLRSLALGDLRRSCDDLPLVGIIWVLD